MRVLWKILKILAGILAYLSLAMSASFFYRVYGQVLGPGAFLLSLPKIMAGALAPVLILMGGVGAVLGFAVGTAERRTRPHLPLGFPLSTLLLVVAGVTAAVVSAGYVRQVTAAHQGFEEAFGVGWQARIPSDIGPLMLQRRWTWKLPAVPDPRWERNVTFWTIPGSDRKLLADVWQPPAGVRPSGLAFIYFHGGGYVAFDKDAGTRPMFRHLASQGHVVMDVAYRLFPETDVPGMVGDAKRAIAWMKRNAARYGVDPDRIVLGGGSAGGHIALLGAYAPDEPLLTPQDVRGEDLRVRGVAVWYASRLMPAGHTDPSQGPVVDAIRGLLTRTMQAWTATFATDAQLLGGPPEEWTGRYRLLSPTTYVRSATPPTLQFQGAHDVYFSALGSAPQLHRALRADGVPSVYVEFPRTDHGFDMIAPEFSPPTRAALYDLDRFLALLAVLDDAGPDAGAEDGR